MDECFGNVMSSVVYMIDSNQFLNCKTKVFLVICRGYHLRRLYDVPKLVELTTVNPVNATINRNTKLKIYKSSSSEKFAVSLVRAFEQYYCYKINENEYQSSLLS